MSFLQTFPEELIIAILSILDIPSIINCKHVCKLLYHLVQDSTIQYKITLAVSGMEDGSSSVSVRERMNLLKKQKAAWDNLDWEIQESIPLNGDAWELVGGVLGTSAGTQLSFFRLPSRLRRIERKDWTIKVGFNVNDFTMDPSQDLLVAIQHKPSADRAASFQCHLVSLTSGSPHPLAACPILPHLSPSRFEGWGYDIRIVGDFVAALFAVDVPHNHGDDELKVWNWKSGRVVLDCHGSKLDCFCFLTDSLIILGVTGSGTHATKLKIIDLNKMTPDRINVDEISFVCSFDFPEVAQPFPMGFHIQSEFHLRYPDPDVPFSTARDNQLFVARLRVFDLDEGEIKIFGVFFPLSTLLHPIERLPPQSEGRNFSWNEWGPSGTRMIALNLPNVWVCFVHGSKFVYCDPGTSQLRLWDFNPNPIHYDAMVNQDAGDSAMDTVTSESEVYGGFVSAVKTGLPYRIAARDFPVTDSSMVVCAALVSEDTILVVKQASAEIAFQILTF